MASIDNKKKAVSDWLNPTVTSREYMVPAAQILASGDWVKKAAEVSRAQAKPSPLDGKPAADWIKEAAAVARKEWAKGQETTKWLNPSRGLEYMVPPRPDAIGKIIERNRAAAAGRRSFSDYLKDTKVGRFSNLLVGAGKSTLSSLMNSLGMLTEDRGIGDRDSYPTDVDPHTPVENKIIEAMEDTSRRSYQAADKVSASAGQDIARGKEGLGKAGNVVADVVVGMAQLGGDILMAQATGGSALVPMAARAFGGSGQEARLEGATPDQQLLYGVGSAAVAVVSEKLLNFAPVLSKAFGKGAADKTVEKGIQAAARKMATTTEGRAAITKLLGISASAGGEGLEEIFEAAVDPLLRRATFDQKAGWEIEDILYDGLIGAIIGGVAGVPGQVAGATNTKSAGIDPAGAVTQAGTDPVVQRQTPGVDSGIAPEGPTLTQDGLQPPEGITTPPQAGTPQGDAQPAQQPTSAQNSLEVKLPTEAQNAPQGLGAMSPQFAYQEAVNQQHSTDTAFTEAERQMPGLRHEDSTHQVVTDQSAMVQAEQRLALDFEGEKADLATKQDWDKADTTTAHLILRDLVSEARDSGDYSEVVKWNKVVEAQKSAQGQALQANKQFAATPEKMTADAAVELDGDNVRKIKPERKAEIIDSVNKQAESLASIPAGDVAGLIELIKRNSQIRRTTGLFSQKTSKALDAAMNYYVANFDGAETVLRAVAETQIRNIAADYKKISPLEAVKSFRIQGMLSKWNTVMRNLTGNTSFDVIETIANNAAVPVDILISKVTGTRSISVDKSWASAAKRRGALEGMLASYIQVALDADATGGQSKYETRTGRTFKMTGSPLERLMSTWAKYEGYLLQTTDEFAKGGVRAEAERGIDALKSRGLVDADALTERAQDIALERTFQNESLPRRAMQKGKDMLNVFKLTDSQGGSFGAGDLGMPFVGVPANLVGQVANYSPIGLANGIYQLGGVLSQAKKGNLSADAQARAVTSIGRGMTGTGLIVAFAALSLKGIIKVAGSEDKDEEAMERSQGHTGIQMNVSALERMAQNGEGDLAWRDGDYLINVGFLEPINGQMAIGAMLADELRETGQVSPGGVGAASLSGTIEALLDLPAMSMFNDVVNNYRYSKGETTGEKAADTALNYAASQAASFVPNFIGGIAGGLDSTVRNSYSSDKWYQKAADSVKARVPVLREGLPASLDSFGQERQANASPLLHVLNQNLLPGAVTRYSQTEVSKELQRLRDAGVDVKYPERRAPKVVGGKELTDDERYIYQQTQGQLYYRLMDTAREAPAWGALSDEEKGRMTKAISSFARGTAKMKVMSVRDDELDEKWEALSRMDDGQVVQYLAQKEAFTTMRDSLGFNAKSFMAFADEINDMPAAERAAALEHMTSDFVNFVDVAEIGVLPRQYYAYKAAIKEVDDNGSISQAECARALLMTNMTNRQKADMWAFKNSTASPDKNPFNGALARRHIPPAETVEIMEEFKRIEKYMDKYRYEDGAPGKSTVQATYFIDWLRREGYSDAEVQAIYDVFPVWSAHRVQKPTAASTEYVKANPRR